MYLFVKFPIVSRIIAFLAAPVCILLLLTSRFFFQSIPDFDATVYSKFTLNAVSITRGKYGIPVIKGKNDSDVFFGMGYAQAQDRLWQMEMQRRLVQGRLSEILGPSSLNSDILMRTLGLYEASKDVLPHLSDDAIRALEAYTNGVNSWLSQDKTLPPEFLLIGHTPEHWRMEDSIALGKLFAITLEGNYLREIRYQALLEILPMEYFSSLFPEIPIDEPNVNIIDFGLNELFKINNSLKNENFFGIKNIGSNAWVIDGSLTESGSPILANDPHLRLQAPSLWYTASIESNNLNVKGMTLPGFPMIIFGENTYISWGGTNLPADTQDLIVEDTDPKNPNFYLDNNQWVEFEVSEEVIQISPSQPKFLREKIAPITLKVRHSSNGPILTDHTYTTGQTLALSWPALDSNDTTFEGFFRLNYARNWTEFQGALAFIISPTLNFVYADKEGNIGYSTAGKIPKRYMNDGALPTNAKDKKSNGFISWDEMPSKLNPENGYIVNANNNTLDNSFPYFISSDWADPARSQRIEYLINQRIKQDKGLDIRYIEEMQSDMVDLNALELINTLTKIYESAEDIQPRNKSVLSEFSGWDGDMKERSSVPALYSSFVRHLKIKLYTDELNRHSKLNDSSIITNFALQSIDAQALVRTLEKDIYWCDNLETQEKESCSFIIDLAIIDASAELRKIAGNSKKDWRWNAINQRIYSHMPFGQQNFLSEIFERKSQGDGSNDTINVAGYSFNESEGYLQFFGAGFRHIFELDKETKYFFLNSTGQSGNVLSRNYDDMIHRMNNNELIKFEEQIIEGKTTTIVPYLKGRISK